MDEPGRSTTSSATEKLREHLRRQTASPATRFAITTISKVKEVADYLLAVPTLFTSHNEVFTKRLNPTSLQTAIGGRGTDRTVHLGDALSGEIY